MVNWKRVGIGAGIVSLFSLGGYAGYRYLTAEQPPPNGENGEPPPPPPPPPPPGECVEGDTQTVECWDGSTIITHRCVGQKWVETGQECPTPECKDGDVKYEQTWEKREDCEKTNATFKCEGGKWKCINKCDCKTHPPELVNYMTKNHLWIYWQKNAIWHVQVAYYDQSSGYYTTTGIPYDGSYMDRLMITLNRLRDDGKINETQYQNGILQGANMGW